MGFFSAIGSAIGSVCSAVGSVCSAIGGAVMGAVGAIASVIAPYIGVIATVVQAIAHVLGVISPEDKPEKLAQAAEQLGKKPEDFNSISEYIQALKDAIKNGDVSIKEELSPEESLKYTLLGTGILIKGLDEKLEMQTSGEFWASVGKANVEPKEVLSILENVKKSENIDTKDVADYLDNKEVSANTTRAEVGDLLETSIKEAKPNLSKEEIEVRLDELLKEKE
ncbi:hypothetical protein [Helicobacter sp.]|uniref:hypothetical protein n=1 Tax=Helicobacter sp. TaxID=218 RepID=UPI0025901AF8|nr:hypothetical protein [Helicobacter sp.]MCI7046507.1 hypothetical protein [Helicobacter sp.]MCI7765867.1 hypothetical protein [Helicobacter sp.]